MRRSMTKRKAASPLPLIAAILMILQLIGHIGGMIFQGDMLSIFSFAPIFYSYVGSIINIIIFLLFAVSLFTKNKRLMILPSILGFLALILSIILEGFRSTYLVYFLIVAAAWFVFMLLCILFALYPQNMKVLQKLWFIPGAVLAIAYVFMYSSENSYLRFALDNSSWYVLPIIALDIALDIVMIVSLLIMTRWLTDSREENLRAIAHTAVVAGSTGQKIEKLVSLKKLLDMGALTQDEFDEKKKQVLG